MIQRSHQTSAFVDPYFLTLYPREVLGAYEDERLTTGIVVQDSYARQLPYQGCLLDRRENPTAIQAILAEVKGVAIWNCPALIDVNPFQAAGWKERIEYTYRLTLPADADGLPAEVSREEQPDTIWTERFLEASPDPDAMLRILSFPCVAQYTTPEGAVAAAIDAQRRAYLLGGEGQWEPIARWLAANPGIRDLDLMSRQPAYQSLGPVKLRSIYGLVREPVV